MISVPGFPGLPENPRPTPAIPGLGLPDFFTDPTPDLLADPDFTLDPPGGTDSCQCDKEKKKKKPAKEREKCMQGTYTQRKKGIKYAPKRQVPCEEFESTKERKAAEKKKPPKLLRKPTTRKPKKRKRNPFESIYF